MSASSGEGAGAGAVARRRVLTELALAGAISAIAALLMAGLISLQKVDGRETLTRAAVRTLRRAGVRSFPRPVVPILVGAPSLVVFGLVVGVQVLRRGRA